MFWKGLLYPKKKKIVSLKYLYYNAYIYVTKSRTKAYLLLIKFIIENKNSLYILYNSYCSVMQTHYSDCLFV